MNRTLGNLENRSACCMEKKGERLVDNGFIAKRKFFAFFNGCSYERQTAVANKTKVNQINQ